MTSVYRYRYMGEFSNIHEITIAALFLVLTLNVGLNVGAQEPPSTDDFRATLQQGFALHKRAKFSEAIPFLEKARHLEPNDYFANLLLGIDLLRTGKPTASIAYLRAAARVNPEEDTPEEYLGEAEAGLGHYSQAARAYMEGVKRGRNSEESVLAWAGFALERFRQVGEDLRSTELGVAAIRKLQTEPTRRVTPLECITPIPTLEARVSELSPAMDSGTKARYQLSLCYAIEANQAATQLSANAQDQAALHRLRGEVLLRLSNKPPEAVEEYKEAIAIRANDPALYERLAEAEMSAGDAEAARQAATQALSIDPHRSSAMGTLAILAMNDRDYGNAVPWLEKMRDESPQDLNVQVELGKALAQTNKPDEAFKNLKEALVAGYPDEKGALHSLEARLLRQLGRDEEASRVAAEAKRLSDSFQNRKRLGSSGNADADQ